MDEVASTPSGGCRLEGILGLEELDSAVAEVEDQIKISDTIRPIAIVGSLILAKVDFPQMFLVGAVMVVQDTLSACCSSPGTSREGFRVAVSCEAGLFTITGQ